MKVRLIHDALVKFPKGSVLEVSEAEGARLLAFKNAEVVKAAPKKEEPAEPKEEKTEKPDKPKKKASKKAKK